MVRVRSRRRTDRDWLGRRFDLRGYHKDPSCDTHHDPLQQCTCRPIFHNVDWVVDWALYSTLMAAGGLLVWVVATY